MPWARRARLPFVLLAGVFGSSVPRSRPRVPSGTNSGGVPMRKLSPRSACALPLGALALVVMMSFPPAAARAEEPAKQPSKARCRPAVRAGRRTPRRPPSRPRSGTGCTRWRSSSSSRRIRRKSSSRSSQDQATQMRAIRAKYMSMSRTPENREAMIEGAEGAAGGPRSSARLGAVRGSDGEAQEDARGKPRADAPADEDLIHVGLEREALARTANDPERTYIAADPRTGPAAMVFKR